MAKLLISLLITFIWSMINPHQWSTWFLEVTPVVVGVILLWVTYRRFQFSTTTYVVLWLAGMIMLIGGHYSYAEMPLFNWLQAKFQLARNYYDRLGHFMQGVAPAMVLRDVLARKTRLQPGKMGWFLVVSCTLGISAFYELVEWGATELGGYGPDKILERQGDLWDTQWDMLMALVGSIFALLI